MQKKDSEMSPNADQHLFNRQKEIPATFFPGGSANKATVGSHGVEMGNVDDEFEIGTVGKTSGRTSKNAILKIREMF